MAHAEELGEIAGVQENFYEENDRKNAWFPHGGRGHFPLGHPRYGLGTIESECRPYPLNGVDRGSDLSYHGASPHLLRLSITREKLRTPLYLALRNQRAKKVLYSQWVL